MTPGERVAQTAEIIGLPLDVQELKTLIDDVLGLEAQHFDHLKGVAEYVYQEWKSGTLTRRNGMEQLAAALRVLGGHI